MIRSARGWILGPLTLSLLLGCSRTPGVLPGGSEELRLTPVDRFDFTGPPVEDITLLPEELSGITRVGGDQYMAVGDEHACVHRLTIRIDHASGRILSAEFGDPTPLLGGEGRLIPDSTMGSDREGIIYEKATESVWISNEYTEADQSRPSIARHRLADGRMTELVRCVEPSPLAVFAKERLNGGFESLTRREDASEVWTGNELTLPVDGDPPTDSSPGVVRLQKMDGAMRAGPQYAYRVDPYATRIATPSKLVGFDISGLTELLALPGGGLLAMERAFAGDFQRMANLRIRIYEVDMDGATDVSKGELARGLAGHTYTAASKRLLWEQNFGLSNSNFEGMTLGPELEGGERSLLLVADNNGGNKQALFAFRIAGLRR